ncbi:DUF1194 domain-containing protein [Halorhodospira halophila]|uniref:DUF1194 domain-containing protein n=1 Tax=Halorhodospira halophila TaxID=1053 RepID=UPI001911B327|nr:DUF1194 domain-containing protein [Halorhodospira halophila]MBK5944033.1 hypothetical protein [Halorhodospira halophila]
MNKIRSALSASLLAVAVGVPMHAAADPIPVDLELVLAVDVSGSVNDPRYQAQKTGYIEAFRNPLVHSAIGSGVIGSIATTYMEWSGATEQSQQVGWTQISSAAAANAFADAIDATTRAFSGLTGISQAIDWSVDSIQNNDFAGTRQIIDISGDGTDNTSGDPADARDDAVAAGMTINGIAIEEATSISLTDYFANNVIGGDSSFVLTADTFEDFEDAILLKLQREIDPNGIPVPGTAALFGLGLLLLAGGGRFSRRIAGAPAQRPTVMA